MLIYEIYKNTIYKELVNFEKLLSTDSCCRWHGNFKQLNVIFIIRIGQNDNNAFFQQFLVILYPNLYFYVPFWINFKCVFFAASARTRF